jgi:hypothetical protein
MNARHRAIVGYALAGAALLGAGALGLGTLVGPPDAAALRVAGLAAYAVQVPAFAALVGARGSRFFVAWGGGMLVRLGLIGGAGVWLARTQAYPAASLLVGLAGFLFALLLLEPFFFRMGLRSE